MYTLKRLMTLTMGSCTYSVNSILEKLIPSTAKGVSTQEKCQSCTSKLSPDIDYCYSGFFYCHSSLLIFFKCGKLHS